MRDISGEVEEKGDVDGLAIELQGCADGGGPVVQGFDRKVLRGVGHVVSSSGSLVSAVRVGRRAGPFEIVPRVDVRRQVFTGDGSDAEGREKRADRGVSAAVGKACHGRTQGVGAVAADQPLHPSGRVGQADAVFAVGQGRMLSQQPDRFLGVRQVGGEDVDLGAVDEGEPRGDAGDRAAELGGLAGPDDVTVRGRRRTDGDDRVAGVDGRDGAVEQGASADLEQRLGGPRREARPPARTIAAAGACPGAVISVSPGAVAPVMRAA